MSKKKLAKQVAQDIGNELSHRAGGIAWDALATDSKMELVEAWAEIIEPIVCPHLETYGRNCE